MRNPKYTYEVTICNTRTGNCGSVTGVSNQRAEVRQEIVEAAWEDYSAFDDDWTGESDEDA